MMMSWSAARPNFRYKLYLQVVSLHKFSLLFPIQNIKRSEGYFDRKQFIFLPNRRLLDFKVTRLKRIESKIAREAVSKTQNTFKTQNSSKTQTCLNLFNMIQIVTIHMILKHV